MKPRHISLLLLSLAMVAEGSEEHTNASMLVWGHARYGPMGNPIGEARSFFIDPARLSTRTSWQAGAESFPVSLGSECNRASLVLRGEIEPTNRLTLSEIDISRLLLGDSRTAGQWHGTSGLSNQWVVAFTYLVQPVGTMRHVVMLLDRAYAREEVDSPSRPRSRVFPAQWRHEPRRKSPQEGGPTPAAAKRPGELRGLLDKPYFSVPRVQWDPFTGEFPLDIEAECSRARQLVSKEIGKSEDSLLLAKVLINTIYPHAAFMAQGLDPMTNRNHWVVSFQYCDVANLGTLQYEVLMLLDGSVLKARDQ